MLHEEHLIIFYDATIAGFADKNSRICSQMEKSVQILCKMFWYGALFHGADYDMRIRNI